MATLTLAEAKFRARLLQVHGVAVVLDLGAREGFTSRTTIVFDASETGAVFVDFKGRELTSATLNGEPVNLALWDGERLPLAVHSGKNTLVVTGTMAYSNTGEGLHQQLDPADGRVYLYATSFLDNAPRWFACFDQPDLKAPYTFDIVTPPDWVVVGNAPASESSPGRWHIGPTQPLATYFVSIAAGEWEYRSRDHGGTKLGLLARRSLAAELEREADDIFQVTAQCFDAYQRLFDVPYCFGDYHQIWAPDFPAGAMENPGCVVLRDQMLFRGTPTDMERASRAAVIAHEMAHMWFGDLVTMRWWDDLWLNESFAEYLGHRIASDATRYELWTEFNLVRKNWGIAADQLPSTHPVAGNGAPDAQAALANFDGISYAKGAAILRQLAATLSDHVFITGLNAHISGHRFGNATFGELLDAWAVAGPVDVYAFSKAWLETAGVDLLAAHVVAGEPVIAQFPPAGRPPVARTHHAAAITLPGGLLVPDVFGMSWARVFPAGGEWPRIGDVSDERIRVSLYNAIRDGVRNIGRHPVGSDWETWVSVPTALRRICEGLPGESHERILQVMLRFAADLAGEWSPPAVRASRRAQVAKLCRALLAEPDPSGDRRVIIFRVLVTVTDSIAELTDWLDGIDLPGGISLDPELRWATLTRLVTLGGDSDAITAELTRDDTASGQEHAAGARAAIPTVAAKAKALRLLLEPSDLRGYELGAVASHLFLPEHTALTDPLLREWFAGINGVAAFQEGWMLAQVAKASFPYANASEETLELAIKTLDGDLDPRIRRVLGDCTDTLRRMTAAHIG
ncbi:MAG: ERAP1-like C-terminal domain-containing protein [Propionibacteriaceae bacterium]|jgi:aminopeptidase N|nr:ERAP1-like C-terminal domain-containing protein [Propionibacteriaceae bacterium]